MKVIYGVEVLHPFTDIITGKLLEIGSTIETDSEQRVQNIVKQQLGKLAYVCHSGKKGKRVLFHHTELYRVGGIETAAQHIARAFPDADITFCVGKNADQAQLMQLAKRHSVILDDETTTYDTDVLVLMNYDSAKRIINRVKAKKVYQFCHADWQGLIDMGAFRGYKLEIHPRVNKVLAVSETAQKGLKTAYGIDSILVPNILCPLDEKKLVFLVLSRATAEKGIDRVLDLVDRFEEAGKDFVVFMCAPLEQTTAAIKKRIENNTKIVVLPALPDSQELLQAASYLVMLSRNESYCYSVREALQRQVPCIVSNIPELRKLIKDGQNGYVLDDDFSNLNVDKIFNQIPKPKAYSEKVSPLWEKVLKGEL